jgi:hypothetical protein
LLSEDILYRERIILQHEDLHLSDSQLQNYALYDIKKLLNRSERSLKEFESMQYPDTLLLRQHSNRLLQEKLYYDRNSLRDEHIKLLSGLNCEQR